MTLLHFEDMDKHTFHIMFSFETELSQATPDFLSEFKLGLTPMCSKCSYWNLPYLVFGLASNFRRVGVIFPIKWERRLDLCHKKIHEFNKGVKYTKHFLQYAELIYVCIYIYMYSQD